jgi:hypothetical protein
MCRIRYRNKTIAFYFSILLKINDFFEINHAKVMPFLHI